MNLRFKIFLIIILISNATLAFGGELYEEYLKSKNPPAKSAEETQYYNQKFADLKIEKSAEGFIKAIKKGDIEVVKLFLDAGIDPNVNYYNAYPIYYAVKANRADIVSLLLERGAHAGIGFEAPVLWALKNKNDNMAKLLIENGAKINYTDYLTGKTLIYYAVKNKHYEVAKLMIENGVKIDRQTGQIIVKNHLQNELGLR
jgi:formamidopyrimidine-DNA glycosylase